MQIAALIIIFVAFIAEICFAGLSIKTSELDESLVDASIDILESCYTDRFNTVGFAGPSVGSIIERISSRESFISATLIGETARSVPHDAVRLSSSYKLQVFVVTVTDPSTLVKTLTQLKDSTWWNHMGSFLLIDLAESKNGCSNAREMLLEAWKVNILNANFMCFHQTRGMLIYTFNPYTSKAPGPWQQENTYGGINGHVMTVFVRKYHKDESRCDKLDFDKTVDLGGHEIRACADNMKRWSFEYIGRPSLNLRVLNVTAQLLINSFNATWKLSEYAELMWDKQDGHREIIGPEEKVRNGSCDISLEFVTTRSGDGGHRYTYPFYQSQLGIVTQYRGDRSQLDKLISVLDKRSRFGVLVVLTITLIFFKCWLRRPLTLAILDLVLIICNAGLQRIPRNTAPRIFLASLFIVVVTIQGIYSGELASLLTKNVRLPTVDSYEDLARGGYTIYGPSYWLSFFDPTTFEGHLVEEYSPDFTHAVLDANAACAGPKVFYIDVAGGDFPLHLARDTLGGIWGGYFIREDWPLEGRVNTVYERLASGGIQNHLYAKEAQGKMHILESYELRDQEPELKVLTFGHLRFAFIILAIGLLCATITFIIEVATFDTTIARPRKRIRRRVQFIE